MSDNQLNYQSGVIPAEAAPTLQETPVAPAALRSCAECPFVRGNLDRPRCDANFSTPNVTSKWREVSQGNWEFLCHSTQGERFPFDESDASNGFVQPQTFKDGGARLCSGILTMQQNELRKFEDAGDYEKYRAQSPAGLTAPALRRLQAIFEAESPDALARWPRADLNDALDPNEFVDTASAEWQFSEHQLTDMFNAKEVLFPTVGECECAFCAGHQDHHATVPVMLAHGVEAHIDVGIAGVIDALAYAGVKTSGSCEDFAPLLFALNRADFWQQRDQAYGAINYSRLLQQPCAYVRFNSDDATQNGVLVALSRHKGVMLEVSAPVAQIGFSLEDAASVEATIREAAGQ